MRTIKNIHNCMIQILHLINFRFFNFFSPNNSLATKIKNLDGHVVENWTPIEIQFKI